MSELISAISFPSINPSPLAYYACLIYYAWVLYRSTSSNNYDEVLNQSISNSSSSMRLVLKRLIWTILLICYYYLRTVSQLRSTVSFGNWYCIRCIFMILFGAIFITYLHYSLSQFLFIMIGMLLFDVFMVICVILLIID